MLRTIVQHAHETQEVLTGTLHDQVGHTLPQDGQSVPLGRQPIHTSKSSVSSGRMSPYLEIHGVELLGLVSDDKWNSIRENFFGIESRAGSVAVENPFIQLRLDPGDSNPSKNKAGMEMVSEYQRILIIPKPPTSREVCLHCTILG